MTFTPVIFAKKKVTLNPTISVHEISAKPKTKEEKAKLYITSDDYNMAVLEVKAIARTHQQKAEMSDEDSSIFMWVVAADAHDFLRGTEKYLFPKRFQNRSVARKALIMYQTHLQENYAGITLEQKAKAMRTASEKLSAWSQLIAQETARIDSQRACDADYMIPLDDAPVQVSSYLPRSRFPE